MSALEEAKALIDAEMTARGYTGTESFGAHAASLRESPPRVSWVPVRIKAGEAERQEDPEYQDDGLTTLEVAEIRIWARGTAGPPVVTDYTELVTAYRLFLASCFEVVGVTVVLLEDFEVTDKLPEGQGIEGRLRLGVRAPVTVKTYGVGSNETITKHRFASDAKGQNPEEG